MRILKRALVVSFAVALAAAPAAGAEPAVDAEPAAGAEAAVDAAGGAAADDAFVEAMTSRGIFRERGALIATGLLVCEDLNQVAELGPNLVPTPLLVMSALHVLPGEAEFVITQAKTNYCPEYS